MATQIFKGYKQVTEAEYNRIPDAEKVGYMWLIRKANDDNKHSRINFGTRPYAELNGDVDCGSWDGEASDEEMEVIPQ